MQIELYFLRSSEQNIAKDILYYAARLDESKQSLEEYPKLAQYTRNYGHYNGDIGVYAIVDNVVAGAAWVRVLADGFGHVDLNTPELVFGVKPDLRNKKIGSQVLEQLFSEVSKVFSQMSLSVREDNPVVKMYERYGFVKVEGSEHKNPAGTYSFTMLKVFGDEVSKVEEEKSLEEACFHKSFRPHN